MSVAQEVELVAQYSDTEKLDNYSGCYFLLKIASMWEDILFSFCSDLSHFKIHT